MFDREKAKKALSHPGTWASYGDASERFVKRLRSVDEFECEECCTGTVFYVKDINKALNFLETGKIPGIVKIA